MKKNLKKAIEVASCALIFQTDWISLFSLSLWQREQISAIFGMSFPARENSPFLDSSQDLLRGIKHVIKHYV
jgi:hypothetical protein